MRSALVALTVTCLALTVVGCGGRRAPEPRYLVVRLEEQNASGQAGTARLTEEGERTRIAIVVTAQTARAQPVYIQEGTCSKVDLSPRPTFRLHDAINRKSTTVLDASLGVLQLAAHAITIHETAKGVLNWTEPTAACGDIPTR